MRSASNSWEVVIMSCNNPVRYYVARGYSYREMTVKCGRTDPYGDRAICDQCSSDREKMRQIRNDEANIRADNDWLRSAGWGDI